jgi:hypothetical protein
LIDLGTWHTFQNGDKLCQLSIACPSALSIDLVYDKFWLAIGAFTSRNNKGNNDNVDGFATELVFGDTIIYRISLLPSR